MRKGRIAEQTGTLGAQRQHLRDDRAVVGRAAAGAARDPGRKIFSRRSRRVRELQERLDAGARQGDHVAVRDVTLLGGGARRGAHEIRQAGEIALALEHERVFLLVGQQVLAERRAERGEPLVDLGQARLRRRGQRGAGARVLDVIALEHAPLLGREAELVAPTMQGIDAAEQALVHQDPVPVLGAARRQHALDLHDRIIGVRAGEQMEHPGHTLQQPAGGFERVDGIGEGRLGGITGNGGDLALMLRKGGIVGRAEMRRFDLRERRHAERAGPWCQQGIGRQRRFPPAPDIVVVCSMALI